MEFFEDTFDYEGIIFYKYGNSEVGIVIDDDNILIGYCACSSSDYEILLVAAGWDKSWYRRVADYTVLEHSHFGPFQENEECSICYGNIYDCSGLLCYHPYYTKCGHIYHRSCLEQWVNNAHFCSKSCPMCRKKIGDESYVMLIEKKFTRNEIDVLDSKATIDNCTFSQHITSRLEYYDMCL